MKKIMGSIELDLSELRSIQLSLLELFSQICKENNLRYFLSGGTMLGAIRHEGYIPWDDDIDVMMPRPDYDRLLQLAPDINSDSIFLKSPYDVRERPYPYTYAKLYDMRTLLIEMPKTKAIKSHVYIDIFPVDGLPQDINECKKYFKSIEKLKKMHRLLSVSKCNTNYGPKWKRLVWSFVYLFSKILDENTVLRIMEKKLRKIRFDESQYAAVVVAGYGERERTTLSSYKQTNVMFEGKEYSGLSGFDEYLSNLYGDYMKLPPKEKQVLSHDYCAFYKNN